MRQALGSEQKLVDFHSILVAWSKFNLHNFSD